MLRTAKTENGTVRGLPADDPRVTVFRGIPFAAPPVGKNRWRVEKHFGKDQVEVVKEFSGTATYSEHIGVTNNTVDFDDTNFEFESDTLFGGRIFFDEIIGVKERKKNWTVKIPKNAQHTIDSLNQEIIRKENLAKLIMGAQHEADSIAKSVVNEKFR